MPSQVWGRDPQEAFEEPYEYEIQEQFAREANTFLTRLYRILNSNKYCYSKEDLSSAKAVWLLAMDTLDSLRDCLTSLDRKEHRVAGKLFRDTIESMDLAAYFHSGNQKSVSALRRWYNDKIVPNSEYRDYVKRTQGTEVFMTVGEYYKSLSRFTHRSYRAILDGYSEGSEGRLVHDRTAELFGNSNGSTTFLVLPQTISSYYALLAELIRSYSSHLFELGLASHEEIKSAFDNSLESETVPRRFLERRSVKPKNSTANNLGQ
jgi:hypothetical protein